MSMPLYVPFLPSGITQVLPHAQLPLAPSLDPLVVSFYRQRREVLTLPGSALLALLDRGLI
jgi:hypothetical protein